MADGSQPVDLVDLTQIAHALGTTKRNAEMRSNKERWAFQERAVRGGRRRFYALDALPKNVHAALLLLRERALPAGESAAAPATKVDAIRDAWERFENAPKHRREVAKRAAAALATIERLVESGMPRLQARHTVVAELQRENTKGASMTTLGRWARDVKGAAVSDWPALLLPAHTGRTATAKCDQVCWDWYRDTYLTRAKPTHEETYRRLEEMADAQGWTVPCARTLRRRIDREVDRITQIIKRDGPEAAARTMPTMQRDATVFGVGEGVNGDGLKFDRLYIRFEDGEILNTGTAWFWQDIHSRRLLAWRLAKTENTDVFRLATYDLTGVCAPTFLLIDNTRVAANKLMTAGATGRHRFRTDEEEGEGLLRMLGMEPHFTNPDKDTGNPGAKPIERAFGIGGIHGMVATNPEIVKRGGTSRDTAIDVDVVRRVIAFEVARFNARTRRRTQACRGVLSFDQAWEAGVAQRPPRVLSERQRRLLLMSREIVTADKRTGEIRIDAGRGPFGQNAYWCPHLAQHTGKKVAVHYDPENLSAGCHVYGLDGRYLFPADHIDRQAFNSTTAGREFGKFKKRVAKSRKQQAADETRMDAVVRADLYAKSVQAPAGPGPAPDSNVTEGHFQRVPDPERDALQRTGTDDVPSQRESQLGDFLKHLEQRRKDTGIDFVGGDA